jgi:hypothetical protein
MKVDIWGSGYIDPHFLDLGSSWKWMILNINVRINEIYLDNYER